MKKVQRSIALILAGAIALTACSKGAETESDNTSEDVTSSVSESAETSGSGGFNGVSGGSHSVKDLTEKGKGYEGIEGTGDYNYGEALQKSVLFYELQRYPYMPTFAPEQSLSPMSLYMPNLRSCACTKSAIALKPDGNLISSDLRCPSTRSGW